MSQPWGLLLSWSPFRHWKKLWGLPWAFSSPAEHPQLSQPGFRAEGPQPLEHLHGLLWIHSSRLMPFPCWGSQGWRQLCPSCHTDIPVSPLLDSAMFPPAAPTRIHHCWCSTSLCSQLCGFLSHSRLLPDLAPFHHSSIFHPDTIFLPSLGRAGNEWYEVAVNIHASAGGNGMGCSPGAARVLPQLLEGVAVQWQAQSPSSTLDAFPLQRQEPLPASEMRDWGSKEIIF